MIWQRWVLGTALLALLSGCNSWERYQASVEANCRQQAKNSTKNSAKRYEDCLRKAAAADRARLRHQDEEWMDSVEDAGRFPSVIIAGPRQPLR